MSEKVTFCPNLDAILKRENRWPKDALIASYSLRHYHNLCRYYILKENPLLNKLNFVFNSFLVNTSWKKHSKYNLGLLVSTKNVLCKVPTFCTVLQQNTTLYHRTRFVRERDQRSL